MNKIFLKDIASLINSEHSAAQAEAKEAVEQSIKMARSALSHALKCGELLIQAKKNIPPEDRALWLEINCPQITKATAQKYTQLFLHYENKPLPDLQTLRQTYLFAGLVSDAPKKLSSSETDLPNIISIEMILGVPFKKWQNKVFNTEFDTANNERLKSWLVFLEEPHQIYLKILNKLNA